MSEVLFDLDVEKVEVNLVVNQGDKKATVTHVLRVPTTEEMLAYRKTSSRFVKDQYVSNSAEANLKLWDKLVQEVKGYSSQSGVDLDTIKGKIPLAHKEAAVLQVISRAELPQDEADFLEQK